MLQERLIKLSDDECVRTQVHSQTPAEIVNWYNLSEGHSFKLSSLNVYPEEPFTCIQSNVQQ